MGKMTFVALNGKKMFFSLFAGKKVTEIWAFLKFLMGIAFRAGRNMVGEYGAVGVLMEKQSPSSYSYGEKREARIMVSRKKKESENAFSLFSLPHDDITSSPHPLFPNHSHDLILGLLLSCRSPPPSGRDPKLRNISRRERKGPPARLTPKLTFLLTLNAFQLLFPPSPPYLSESGSPCFVVWERERGWDPYPLQEVLKQSNLLVERQKDRRREKEGLDEEQN